MMTMTLRIAMKCGLCGCYLDSTPNYAAILFGSLFGSTCPRCNSIQDPADIKWLKKLYRYVKTRKDGKNITRIEFINIIKDNYPQIEISKEIKKWQN